jgi:hypothetical protein
MKKSGALTLSFRTSAVDYLRISVGAKFEGGRDAGSPDRERRWAGQLGLNAYGFASFWGHSAVDTWMGCLSDDRIVKDRGGIPSQPTGEPASRSLGLALQPLICDQEADGCSLRSHLRGGESLGDSRHSSTVEPVLRFWEDLVTDGETRHCRPGLSATRFARPPGRDRPRRAAFRKQRRDWYGTP